MADIRVTEIENMPVLSSILPYHFANGSTFDAVETCCESCKSEIGPEFIRAKISAPNDHVIMLEAYALCFDCRLITPVVPLRIRDDGSLLAQNRAGYWKEYRYAAEKSTGLLSRLKELLGGIK